MACSGSRNQSAYSRMRETVNKTLLWGRSVGKCQVSVLQFLKISKLLIPEINNRTLENSVAKPRLLAERQPPQRTGRPPGPCSLDPDFSLWHQQPPLVQAAKRGSGLVIHRLAIGRRDIRRQRREIELETGHAFTPLGWLCHVLTESDLTTHS